MCHPECPFCAREAWKWVKARMRQMEEKHYRRRRPRTASEAAIVAGVWAFFTWVADPKEGQKISFAEAAATSIKPPHVDVTPGYEPGREGSSPSGGTAEESKIH